MRRTKIVATVGPASRDEAILARLVEAGVDVFRLNFSHGSHQEHGATMAAIRRISAQAGRTVAVLQDLQGPRIRTGLLAGGESLQLVPGGTLTLTTDPVEGSAGRVSVSYQGLPSEVRAGDRVLIADGIIELRVQSTTATEVRTEVVRGGELGERKGINLPGVRINAPSLTDKDLADLRFGVAQGVDYIALSFVRRADDFRAARAALKELGARVPLIAKVENHEAIARLDEVLRASDGVMVARGDLGVELGPEKVPMLQKQMLRRANDLGIPSITATQMVESMVGSPWPTRAETSDVANAILDGTDAVMLSAETAIGAYPVESVQVMDSIAREVEAHETWADAGAPSPPNLAHSLAHASTLLATEIHAKAMVAFTRNGLTARLLSKERPGLPIYAFTTAPSAYRRLALWHGVTPLMGRFTRNTDERIASMLAELRRRDLVAGGDNVVVVRVARSQASRIANFVTVRRVPR
jgi:pyruvate kinase